MMIIIGIIWIILFIVTGEKVANHIRAKAASGVYGRYSYKPSEMGLGGTPFEGSDR